MKILTLVFANINALQGSWRIDFSQQGLFAIVGDTGAGKTSILDAICLALYARTPRLKDISKSHNELMHKNTGYLSAEVEISTHGQRYLFSFYQQRAHKKPTGELQDSKRRLSIYQDGAYRTISDKKSVVEKKAAEILAMNFDQFTRSVLLAQGDFSQFLNSSAHERGAMLENITGTHFYSAISMKAYEKNKAFDEQIRQLEQQIGVLDNTSTDYDNLWHALKNSENALKQAMHDQDALNTQCLAITNYQNAKQQHAQDTSAHEKAQQTLDDFSEQSALLDDHYRAEHVNADFARWQDNSRVLADLEQTISAQRMQRQQLQNDQQIQQKQQKHLSQAVEKSQKLYHEHQPTLKQAITLDNELTAVRAQQDAIAKQQQNLRSEKARLSAERQIITQNLSETRKQIQERQQWLTQPQHLHAYQNSDFFIEQCSLFKNLSTAYKNALENAASSKKTQKKQLEQKTQLQEHFHTQEQKLQQLNTSARQAALVLQRQLSNTTNANNNALIDKNSRKNAQARAQKILILAQQYAQDAKHLQHNDIRLAQRQQQLQQKAQTLQELAKHLDTHNNTLMIAKNNYDAAKKLYELAQENRLLREKLAHLADGDPCPLCGSQTHPAKNHVAPNNDDLMALQDNYQQIKTRYYELKDAIITLEARQQHKNQQYIDDDSAWQQEQVAHKAQCDALQSALTQAGFGEQYLNETNTDQVTATGFAEKVQQWVTVCQNRLTALTDAIDLYEQCTDAQQNAVHTLQKLGNDLAVLEKELARSALDANQNSADLAQKQQMLLACLDAICRITNDHSDDENDTEQKLKHALQCFENIDPEPILNQWRGLAGTLHRLKNHYAQKQSAQDSDEKHAQELRQRLDNCSEKQCYLTQQVKKLAAEADALNNNIDQLLTQRRTILPDYSTPAQQLQTLNDAIYQAKKQLELCEQTLYAQKTQLQVLDTQIAAEQSRYATLNLQSIKLHQCLNNSLHKNGFASLKQYQQALLAPDTSQQLLQQKQHLNQQYALSLQQLTHTKNTIKNLAKQYPQIDDLDASTLQSQLAASKAHSAELAQHLGKLKHQKQQFDERKRIHQSQMDNLNQLKQQAQVWQLLNELIGSADGKKLRNYVQELHLQELLTYANHHLHKMHQRYELIASQDDKIKLGIDIIDHHQGGQIRSSKNLSGGEQFMVSLALALGLSQFSSKNAAIDSLFLDEGFGTLDETHLTIALSALNELHMAGKTIGVISHMPALKEQITQHITVEKKPSGYSVLRGFGVAPGTL